MKNNHYIITAYYDVTTDIFLTTGFHSSFKNGSHSKSIPLENTYKNRTVAEKEKALLKQNYKENSEYSEKSKNTKWAVVKLDEHTNVASYLDKETDTLHHYLR